MKRAHEELRGVVPGSTGRTQTAEQIIHPRHEKAHPHRNCAATEQTYTLEADRPISSGVLGWYCSPTHLSHQ